VGLHASCSKALKNVSYFKERTEMCTINLLVIYRQAI